MSCERFSQGSSTNEVNVSGGIQENHVSSSRMMIIPSQNEGTASPAIENTRIVWSIQVSLKIADRVPSGSASRTARMVAMTATWSESSSRMPISYATDLPVHMETPKSPCSTPPNHLKNCTHI